MAKNVVHFDGLFWEALYSGRFEVMSPKRDTPYPPNGLISTILGWRGNQSPDNRIIRREPQDMHGLKQESVS